MTPLLELGTLKAKTDLVLSFLAAKLSSRESSWSLRVKANFQLYSWRRSVHAPGFR